MSKAYRFLLARHRVGSFKNEHFCFCTNSRRTHIQKLLFWDCARKNITAVADGWVSISGYNYLILHEFLPRFCKHKNVGWGNTTPFLRLKMKFVMKFAESGSLWHSRPRAIKLKTSLFSQNEISFENVVRRTFVTSWLFV